MKATIEKTVDPWGFVVTITPDKGADKRWFINPADYDKWCDGATATDWGGLVWATVPNILTVNEQDTLAALVDDLNAEPPKFPVSTVRTYSSPPLKHPLKAGTTMSTRRPKGSLERDLLLVCNDFVTGVIHSDNPCLTPSHAALLIGERAIAEAAKGGLMPEFPAPSPGAITNIMKKWRDCGYAQSLDKPFGFLNYTEQAYRPEIESADDLVKEQKETAAITKAMGLIPGPDVEEPTVVTGTVSFDTVSANTDGTSTTITLPNAEVTYGTAIAPVGGEPITWTIGSDPT